MTMDEEYGKANGLDEFDIGKKLKMFAQDYQILRITAEYDSQKAGAFKQARNVGTIGH